MKINSLICSLMGMGVTFLLIPQIIRYANSREKLAARKDLHHTHRTPVPRLGGVALVAAYLVIEIFSRVTSQERFSLFSVNNVVLLGSLSMFAMGLWDDISPLGAKKKLGLQIVIALMVCYLGVGIHLFKIPFSSRIIDLGGWGVLFTVIWLLAITNLINLIDGADGLAGGISLMLMVLIACIGQQTGNYHLLGAGMAGSLVGFLYYNFPPAKIYLGDGGAYFLGFLIGVVSLVNSHKGEIFGALAAPMFVLALPIVDMSLAICRRGLRGLPVFRPDRRHLHHHLLNMGFSRKQVVLSFYVLTLLFLLLGLLAFSMQRRFVLGLSFVSLSILLACARNLRFSRPWFDVIKVVKGAVSMRQDVRYALILSNLLAVEGSRRKSLEELWTDLILTAQRLGFSRVRVSFESFQRDWESCPKEQETRSVSFNLGSGLIELAAPRQKDFRKGRVTSAAEGGPVLGFAITSNFRITEEKVFEVASELVADGWDKAVSNWRKLDQSGPPVGGREILSPQSLGA